MDEMHISVQSAENTRIDKLMQQLKTTLQGLSDDEAQKRLTRFGLNEISAESKSSLIKFLSYLWGPIPWMIEAAALLSLIAGHWVDLGIISVLLFFNAVVIPRSP